MADASGSERVTGVAEERRADRRGMVLALATVGFLVNFWAWALISPLGVAYREQLGLTAFQQALLVALPVVVGSIGRIPVGALTDRLGARLILAMLLSALWPITRLVHVVSAPIGYLWRPYIEYRAASPGSVPAPTAADGNGSAASPPLTRSPG